MPHLTKIETKGLFKTEGGEHTPKAAYGSADQEYSDMSLSVKTAQCSSEMDYRMSRLPGLAKVADMDVQNRPARKRA